MNLAALKPVAEMHRYNTLILMRASYLFRALQLVASGDCSTALDVIDDMRRMLVSSLVFFLRPFSSIICSASFQALRRIDPHRALKRIDHTAKRC